jgi:hypothetical protein
VGAAIKTGNEIYEDSTVFQMLPFYVRSFVLYSKDTHSTVKVEILIIQIWCMWVFYISWKWLLKKLKYVALSYTAEYHQM